MDRLTMKGLVFIEHWSILALCIKKHELSWWHSGSDVAGAWLEEGGVRRLQ